MHKIYFILTFTIKLLEINEVKISSPPFFNHHKSNPAIASFK